MMPKPNTIRQGDVLDVLRSWPDGFVQCVVTSPPYWGLRCYGVEGQLGLEPTPELYIENMVAVFREVRRVLRDDGICWINLGDSFWGGGNNRGNTKSISDKQASNAGATGQCAEHQKNIGKHPVLKPKDLCGMPWRLALALQADGWWLRSDIIWHKPNPMPESCTDRPTKSHEYIFLLTKRAKYFYDSFAVREKALDTDAASDVRCNHGNQEMHDLLSPASSDSILSPKERDEQRGDLQTMRKKTSNRMATNALGEGQREENVSEIQCERPREGEPQGIQSIRKTSVGRQRMEEIEKRKGERGALSKESQKESGSQEVLRKRKGQSRNRQIPCNSEGEGVPSTRGSQKKIPDVEYEIQPNSGRVGSDQEEVQERLCVLRENQSSTDERSCDTSVEGRSSCDGEHSTSLPKLQRQEGQQAHSTRNLRSVWTVATQAYKFAHFACFPEKLIEPCILAGTSERGCCAECGKPWVRETEKNVEYTRNSKDGKAANYRENTGTLGGPTRLHLRPEVSRVTTGWRAACSCNADTVPCTVLDIFMGAGTTAVVAKTHKRNWIGVELSQPYIEIANTRIRNTQERLF